jgi:hypothetical protein
MERLDFLETVEPDHNTRVRNNELDWNLLIQGGMMHGVENDEIPTATRNFKYCIG